MMKGKSILGYCVAILVLLLAYPAWVLCQASPGEKALKLLKETDGERVGTVFGTVNRHPAMVPEPDPEQEGIPLIVRDDRTSHILEAGIGFTIPRDAEGVSILKSGTGLVVFKMADYKFSTSFNSGGPFFPFRLKGTDRDKALKSLNSIGIEPSESQAAVNEAYQSLEELSDEEILAKLISLDLHKLAETSETSAIAEMLMLSDIGYPDVGGWTSHWQFTVDTPEGLRSCHTLQAEHGDAGPGKEKFYVYVFSSAGDVVLSGTLIEQVRDLSEAELVERHLAHVRAIARVQ